MSSRIRVEAPKMSGHTTLYSVFYLKAEWFKSSTIKTRYLTILFFIWMGVNGIIIFPFLT